MLYLSVLYTPCLKRYTDIGPKDIGPTDIGPKDIGPTGHWSDGTLVRRYIGPTGHMSDKTLVRRDIYRTVSPTVFMQLSNIKFLRIKNIKKALKNACNHFPYLI